MFLPHPQVRFYPVLRVRAEVDTQTERFASRLTTSTSPFLFLAVAPPPPPPPTFSTDLPSCPRRAPD
ncbi:hypothetical protein GWI33_015694 [Rhynchophorus ferrugineus]|uniref:Uncharacterized protein n=1 Tax=Rhynchophorus ferrugineus TaxID=354439 RepID=A0A834ICQ8_RHYFE|nr:hypothetical protein GWI33_015694 [Rhynchophorus ferrugineus]